MTVSLGLTLTRESSESTANPMSSPRKNGPFWFLDFISIHRLAQESRPVYQVSTMPPKGFHFCTAISYTALHFLFISNSDVSSYKTWAVAVFQEMYEKLRETQQPASIQTVRRFGPSVQCAGLVFWAMWCPKNFLHCYLTVTFACVEQFTAYSNNSNFSWLFLLMQSEEYNCFQLFSMNNIFSEQLYAQHFIWSWIISLAYNFWVEIIGS